jgi:putative protease
VGFFDLLPRVVFFEYNNKLPWNYPDINFIMPPIKTSPEVLAPAGDWDSLRAACANGANAVYFGLSDFNARARAANFELSELGKVMQYLHHRNVKGFVTLNTLIFSDELPLVVDFVQACVQHQVDAVIVQDLGLAKLISRLAPQLPIHASTQMTLTEPRGINFMNSLVPLERVVLARELSLENIRDVAEHSEVDLEVFVHGALCVAYSGQCLTSEALGGRSANRGQCAQACRLPYEMIVDGQKQDLGDRAYLLSPQDLAGYEQISDLIASGVVSFKIEGRLKGPAYVAATTKTYRDAVDAAEQQKAFHLSRERVRELELTFSRGLTSGFLEGVNHQKLVRGRFPKSRGLLLGTVKALTSRGVIVTLAERDVSVIKAGDGIVIDLGKPEQQEPGGRVWRVVCRLSQEEVELQLAPENDSWHSVPVGAMVWKTDDPALKKKLEATFHNDPIVHRKELFAELTGQIGGKLVLILRDRWGNSARAEWEGPLQQANQRPATIESVTKQLSRLGETPYSLAEVKLDIREPVLIPASVLNDLRRQAIAQLESAIFGACEKQINRNALEELRKELVPVPPPPEQTPAQLAVLVRSLEQLRAVLPHRPDRVYCDFEDVRNYREGVELAKQARIPVGVATLRILKPKEEGFLKPILSAKPDMILIRNLGSLCYFQEQAPATPLIADFSLNIANELTAGLLHRIGFSILTPSYDLNWEQFSAMVRRSPPSWFEPVIHQHMPMFHMEHCVFAAFLSNGKDHRDCGRPCDRHRVELRDRVGAAFPVIADAGCRNTVYNSVAQSAAEYVSGMLKLGIQRFRIDLTRESPKQIGLLIDKYRQVISGQLTGQKVWWELQAMNQLGVTRGTLQLV